VDPDDPARFYPEAGGIGEPFTGCDTVHHDGHIPYVDAVLSRRIDHKRSRGVGPVGSSAVPSASAWREREVIVERDAVEGLRQPLETGASDGIPERTIHEIQVFEFGPVTCPAYEGASASVRQKVTSKVFERKHVYFQTL
jgi:hypothetical protein